MRESILAEQTHDFVRSQQWQAAVLPFGATEPHNLHMPYGTDNFQVEELGELACQRAWDAGARVALLPTMPYGVNTNHLKIPGALACSVTPTTLLALLTDLVDSLERQGVRKLVLLNGHGGNELKPLTRELHHRTGVFLCVCDWFRMAQGFIPGVVREAGRTRRRGGNQPRPGLFPGTDAHGVGRRRRGAAVALRGRQQRLGGMTRPWHLATPSTGLGDPSAATAEKGRRLMEALAERLGMFLTELAASPMDEMFPF